MLCLLLSSALAENKELRDWLKDAEDVEIDWEYLKTCNRYFWKEADLNNDGIDEEIGIFFQWKGEGWWSDDIGYVICIFDQNQNIVYGKEVVRYQEVASLEIKDVDDDVFKEVIITAGKTVFFDAKTIIYGWDGNAFIREKVIDGGEDEGYR